MHHITTSPEASSLAGVRSTDTLEALLSGIIDYAGLFPPAKLAMAPAVEEYDHQRRSAERWMLGRFVVPVARLGELATAAAGLDRESDPWSLSALSTSDPLQARRAIDAFGEHHGEQLQVVSIEHRPAEPAAIVQAAEAFSGFEVFFELPHGHDLGPWMAAVAAVGGRAKIRSGGITADAFPSCSEMARFLATAVRFGVALKATAGLHHPLRGEYRLTYEADSPTGTMHGFLNVFLAAAGLWSKQLDEVAAADLLDERSAAAIVADGQGVRWRDLVLDAATLADARRGLALSYGSCSFAEPVQELRHLGLLL